MRDLQGLAACAGELVLQGVMWLADRVYLLLFSWWVAA